MKPKRRRYLSAVASFVLFLAWPAASGLALADAAAPASVLGLQNPLSDATILIIRHAEKPSKGAGLSAEGRARAAAYVGYFQNYRVEGRLLSFDYMAAADDSEHSHRSRLTLEPLANAIGLKPDQRFQPGRAQSLASELKSRAHGKDMLICWHHGEIPELLAALGADPKHLLPGGEWPDKQYSWVLQLRYDHEGRLIKGKTRRIKERLMPGD